MKLSLLLLPAVAGIAFAGAFFARRATAPPPPVAVHSVAPVIRPEDVAARFSKSWSAALTKMDPVLRAEAMLASLAGTGRVSLPGLAERHRDDPAVLQLILHRWAELDAAAALRWVRDSLRGEGHLLLEALEQVAEVWAARDPSALAAWLKEPLQRSYQDVLLQILTGAVFTRDPAAAFALARDFPEQWSLPPGAMSWVKLNPAAAAQALTALPLNNRSKSLAERAAAAWAEQDGAAAAAWFAGLAKTRGPVAVSLLQRVLKTWAGQDPTAATQFAATQPHGNRLAYEPLQKWAAKDPAAALAWLEAAAHPSERLSLVHGTILAAARNDITATAALVNQMAEGSLRDKAAAALGEVWAGTDPTAALTWFTEQPAGPGRDEAVVRAARAWAEKDAGAAAAWAKSVPDGLLPRNTYNSIMDSLRRDPAAAYAWLNELPPAAARDAAHRLMGYSESDFRAALALPAGIYRNEVLDHVAGRFVRHSPDVVVAQAASLSPAQRADIRRVLEAIEPVPEVTPRSALTTEKKAELLQRLR